MLIETTALKQHVKHGNILLGESKIKILNLELGIAEKTYETRWDHDHAASNKLANP